MRRTIDDLVSKISLSGEDCPRDGRRINNDGDTATYYSRYASDTIVE